MMRERVGLPWSAVVVVVIAIGLVLLLVFGLSGCTALFPTAVDPCPLPAAQHPEAWHVQVVRDAAGAELYRTYVCTTGAVAQ